jgi:hypothetical protein
VAATPQRAPPEVDDMVPEHGQCTGVGWHCVIADARSRLDPCTRAGPYARRLQRAGSRILPRCSVTPQNPLTRVPRSYPGGYLGRLAHDHGTTAPQATMVTGLAVEWLRVSWFDGDVGQSGSEVTLRVTGDRSATCIDDHASFRSHSQRRQTGGFFWGS